MPNYDYKCTNCKTIFERLLSFEDSNKKQFCPNCESKQTEKMLSAPNVCKSESQGFSSSPCSSPSGFT